MECFLHLCRTGFVLFIYCSLHHVGSSSPINFREETRNIFTTIFHKYQNRIRPHKYEDYKPIEMKAALAIVQVDGLDVNKQELDVTVDARVSWYDSRLYWRSETIKYITVNESTVWTPDYSFVDALSSPEVIVNPRFVLILSNGNIVIYRRYKMKLYCETNSSALMQECKVLLGSNQFPSQEQIFDVINCSVTHKLYNKDWDIELAGEYLGERQMVGDIAFENRNQSLAGCTLSFQKIVPIETTMASMLIATPSSAATTPLGCWTMCILLMFSLVHMM